MAKQSTEVAPMGNYRFLKIKNAKLFTATRAGIIKSFLSRKMIIMETATIIKMGMNNTNRFFLISFEFSQLKLNPFNLK